MYDPIFAKSFSPHERKRIGFCSLILCFIVALSFSSTFLHPLPRIGGAVNLQLPIRNIEDVLVIDGMSENSKPTVGNAAADVQLVINGTENMLVVDGKSVISQLIAIETTKVVPTTMCRSLEANAADYCEIEGDIRIEPNSSTIFVHQTISNSFTIQPYPRKGISGVKIWTVKLVGNNNIPKCTHTYTLPAILFSVGGFSGNYFHDFSDLIFPLYSTSIQFRKEVHFLASDYKPWWLSKYRQILNKLTGHEILDIDREKSQVRCYSKMIVGLNFHKELISSSSTSSMHNFRQLLRQTYSLERKTAIKLRKGDGKKPRLMIISRKRTRVLMNDREVSRLARKSGYEVVVLAEADFKTNISRFARTVNSCDVLMGVHGAGLTNMVFLPDNGILIQVVPFGGIDGFARLDFGNPSAGMNIRYLEYKITAKESSLSQHYPVDHPILKDPISFNRKGWDVLRSIYLDKQNVTIDMHRFKGVLAKTLRLLRH
ncbi:hypothetical protein BUALT_Bualt02G0080300 [Buddleja alternifolia]|uniref:Glycosyltransferase 61 catalytic domain-containing protein n=1 Tax=Buddleja alternifolia TaxID=168488 RepID=A0AAV6Y703_9LAMI|nr:hypothetical protein BUALT_Bualt02G0080300 [Buddleja alternifolia]